MREQMIKDNLFSASHREALWDILWDGAIAGLCLISQDGFFIKANASFCKIVEYTEPELQKMKFADITVPSDIDPDLQLSEEVASGKRKSYDMIKSYMTKTRRVVFVHLRVLPFKINDEFVYFVSQVFEITPTQANMIDSNPGELKLEKINNFKFMKSLKKLKEWGPVIGFAIGGVIAGLGYVLGFAGV